VTLNNVLLIKT